MHDLESFFSRNYEKSINEQMLFRLFVFPVQDVLDYVYCVNKIDLEDILIYVLDNLPPVLQTRDIFQFSNFEDGTSRLCEVIKKENDPGLSFINIGKLLCNDGKERNKTALNKYGENHAKLGLGLGLLHEITNTYYLTCLGYVYNDLPNVEREKLLVRLILRSNLVRFFYRLFEESKTINCRETLNFISDSTYNRRKGNVKNVIQKLLLAQDYDFWPFIKSIVY